MSFIGLIGRSSHGSLGDTLVLISVSPHSEVVSLTGVVIVVVVLSVFVPSSFVAVVNVSNVSSAAAGTSPWTVVVASLLCVASVAWFVGGDTLLLSLALPWAVVV